MQFSVLGDSEEAEFLCRAVNASAQHRISVCCVAPLLAQRLSGDGIPFRLVDSQEEAIQASGIDVVVIAVRNADESISLARQASQADRHVVVVPPDDASTAFSYELHLLLDESQRGLVALSGRWYLQPDSPTALVNAAPDTVRQLFMDLPLQVEPQQQKRQELLAVDAACGCGPEFSQVTALDVKGVDGQCLSRTITLAASQESGKSVPPATISFRSELNSVPDRSIRLLMTDGSTTTVASALPASVQSGRIDDGQGMLQRLVNALQTPAECQQQMEQFSNTLELMNGVEKSLRRRRTVDVYFDGISERSAFKTQMTAIGCGVLTYIMFGLVGFLIIGKVADLPPTVLKIGRALWIAPVVVFLLAQFLLPLARERGERRSAETAPDP